MGDKSGVRIGSDSSIEIDFYFRGVRCRERIKLEPNEKNLKYAERFKARIEDEIAKNQFDYARHFPESRKKIQLFYGVRGDEITIETYIQKWLEEEKQNVRHSTWQGYQQMVKGSIIPVFGKLRLSELTRRHVKDWMGTRTDVSPKTLGNTLSVLRIALDEAVEDEFIEVSPLAGWHMKRLKSSKTRGRRARYQVDPFSIEEQVAIFSAMSGQNLHMMQFAFWTGLRTSELCGLDWTDIDWIRGVVRVRFVLTRGMKEPEEDTKTPAGERDVKLLPPAREALVRQKQFTFLKNREVFENPKTGERWMGPYPIWEMWGSALKRAGVRYRNPYQTRHTYASTLLQAGEPVQWVAAQMGHKNWALTAKVYSRWIPDNLPEVGGKAAALWSTFDKRKTDLADN